MPLAQTSWHWSKLLIYVPVSIITLCCSICNFPFLFFPPLLLYNFSFFLSLSCPFRSFDVLSFNLFLLITFCSFLFDLPPLPPLFSYRYISLLFSSLSLSLSLFSPCSSHPLAHYQRSVCCHVHHESQVLVKYPICNSLFTHCCNISTRTFLWYMFHHCIYMYKGV